MMKKVLVSLAAAAMLGVGMQGTATAAPTGWPEGCVSHRLKGSDTNGWMAMCDTPNGGRWKASAKCVPWGGGPVVLHDAVAWASNGYSIAYCPPLTQVAGGSYWSRSY